MMYQALGQLEEAYLCGCVPLCSRQGSCWWSTSGTLNPGPADFRVCRAVKAALAPPEAEYCHLSTQVCGPQPGPQGGWEQ